MNPQQIKGKLIERGVKQREIAARLGCTPQLVSMVISGHRANRYIQAAIARAISRPRSKVFTDRVAA